MCALCDRIYGGKKLQCNVQASSSSSVIIGDHHNHFNWSQVIVTLRPFGSGDSNFWIGWHQKIENGYFRILLWWKQWIMCVCVRERESFYDPF